MWFGDKCVGSDGAGAGSDDDPSSFGTPVRITANPKNFSAYVLVPNHPTGKDHIFIDRLGYRPRNDEDARALANAYVNQAHDQVAAGTFELGGGDEFGRRIMIVVEIRGLRLRSGWLLRPDGTLVLATPFTGFAS